MARSGDSEDQAWLTMPAVYADTFEVSVRGTSGIARIVFGEYAGRNQPYFSRAAIVMPLQDAKAFVRVLGRLIADLEKDQAAAKESGASVRDTDV